jgi:cell division transport system permease protein
MTPDKMPTSYQCVPTVPQNAFVIEQAYTGQPGVFQVTAPEQQIRQMQKTIHVLQVVFLALAGVLLLSATVLILNTIRMAIFARRREVSVMKLVGATNWFIRIPFITEGFVQGLLGSVVAVGATTAVQTWYPLSSEYQISLANLWGTNVVVIVLGISIGSIGSALGIRRFLDV